jgi:CBS domain-containing protein
MAEKWAKRSGLSSFLSMFDQNKLQQRTLLSLIDDPEILDIAIAEADRIVKGFDSPNSGILFTIPISQVLGLQKWGIELVEESVPEFNQVESERSQLMAWFEQDVKERYGEDALKDWSGQRNIQVSEILPQLKIPPTIVKVDTSLFDVVSHLQNNPGMPAACVVNAEDRLVGVIPLRGLADVVMAPVMPEAYINDSEGYDKALNFADINKLPVAGAVMSDPVYIAEDETMEKAFQRMKDRRLSGVPVVDKLYRIKGFITMLELMTVCFPPQKA